MGEIYARAEQVLIWLGSGDADVAETLSVLSQGYYSSGPVSTARTTMRKAVMERHNMMGRWSDEYLLWEKCDRLCSLPYWNRIWIVQEFILARQRTLLYGAVECHEQELTDFLKAEALQRQYQEAVGLPRKFFARAMVLCEEGLSSSRARAGRLSLLECLGRYGDARCTDFHDSVYAFRSLCANGNLFPVDYSTTKTEFLTIVLLFCCMQPLPQASDSPKKSEWAKYFSLDAILSNVLGLYGLPPPKTPEPACPRLPFPPTRPAFHAPQLPNKITIDLNARGDAAVLRQWIRQGFRDDLQPELPEKFLRILQTGDICYWIDWAFTMLFARADGDRYRIVARVTIRGSDPYHCSAELYTPHLHGAYIQPRAVGGSGPDQNIDRLALKSTYEGVLLFGLSNSHPDREEVLRLLALNNGGHNHPDWIERVDFSYETLHDLDDGAGRMVKARMRLREPRAGNSQSPPMAGLKSTSQLPRTSLIRQSVQPLRRVFDQKQEPGLKEVVTREVAR